MKRATDEIARWLGILSTGVLDGEDAERSVARAARVLGEARLAELRTWFAVTPKDLVREAKCAVIEAAIAVAQADRKIADAERELVARLVQLAVLDADAQARLAAALDAHLDLAAIATRITQPALAELALALAWQMANADESVDDAERGVYGELAKRLSIEPTRARALRTLAD